MPEVTYAPGSPFARAAAPHSARPDTTEHEGEPPPHLPTDGDGRQELANLEARIVALRRRWSETVITLAGAALAAAPMVTEAALSGDQLTDVEFVTATVAGLALSTAGLVAGERLRILHAEAHERAEQERNHTGAAREKDTANGPDHS